MEVNIIDTSVSVVPVDDVVQTIAIDSSVTAVQVVESGPQGPMGEVSTAQLQAYAQPLNSNLTSIAALSTTAIGRSLLLESVSPVGSGALARVTSPTFTTPNIGVATGTSLTLGLNGLSTGANSNHLIIGNANAGNIFNFAQTQLRMRVDGSYTAVNTTDTNTGSVDTTLSRSSAGVWQMGTTTNNSLGSLLLYDLTAGGTIATNNLRSNNAAVFSIQTLYAGGNNGSINIQAGQVSLQANGVNTVLFTGGSAVDTTVTAYNSGASINLGRTISGDITLTPGQGGGGKVILSMNAGPAQLWMSGTAGNARSFVYQSSNVSRWNLYTDVTAETGSNAGSDFKIARYSDAGSFLGNAITITRSTGDATFSGAITGSFVGNLTSATNSNINIGANGTGKTYICTSGSTGGLDIANASCSIAMYGPVNVGNSFTVAVTGTTVFKLNSYTSGNPRMSFALDGTDNSFFGLTRTGTQMTLQSDNGLKIRNSADSADTALTAGIGTFSECRITDTNTRFYKVDANTLGFQVLGNTIFSVYAGSTRFIGEIEMSNTKSICFNPATAGGGGQDVSLYRSGTSTLAVGAGGAAGTGNFIANNITANTNIFAYGNISTSTTTGDFRLNSASYSRVGAIVTGGNWVGGYNIAGSASNVVRDSTGTVSGIYYGLSGLWFYALASGASGVISPNMTLDSTNGLTVLNNINANATIQINNSTDYSQIYRQATSTGRLVITRPNSTTESISIGGGNAELWIRGGLGVISHSGTDYAIMATSTTNLAIHAQSGGYVDLMTGNTTRARLSAAGGFSIGTTTDAGVTNLLVAGTITSNGKITATVSSNQLQVGPSTNTGFVVNCTDVSFGRQIQVQNIHSAIGVVAYDNGATIGMGRIGAGNDSTIWTNSTAGVMRFIVNNDTTLAMAINQSSGGVSIGTATDAGAGNLLVNGTVTATGSQSFIGGAAGATNGYIRLYSATSSREANIYNTTGSGLTIDTASNAYPITINGSQVNLAPSNGVIITTASSAVKGLIVKAFTGQTNNLQEWQTAAGTPISAINAAGSFISGNGISLFGNNSIAGCGMLALATSASSIPIITKGFASQTANLQEWQNSASAVLSNIASTGYLNIGTSVTAAGNRQICLNDTTLVAISLQKAGAEKWAIASDGSDSDAFSIQKSGVGPVMRLDFSTLTASFKGVTATANTAASQALIVKGFTSQTANLQEWQNSSGTVLSIVTPNGSILSTSPTAGVGHGTGAGGAVTQITSRSTGVTINTICGTITLVSAAGSASYTTMTVTNSTVSITDIPRVVQQSGTDKYIINVTGVTNGSFSITYCTTGGTTTEQPIFNFLIQKSVSS